MVLEFRVELFLASQLVTKTYWVVAWTLSSSMEYLLAHLNKSSIVVGGFLAKDSKKGIPGPTTTPESYSRSSLGGSGTMKESG